MFFSRFFLIQAEEKNPRFKIIDLFNVSQHSFDTSLYIKPSLEIVEKG